MNYILYNAKSNRGNSAEILKNLEEKLGEFKKINVLDEIDYEQLFNNAAADDKFYLVGGDGTLNHFVNNVQNIKINNEVWFCTAGTGNDFYNDMKDSKYQIDGMIHLNDLIKDLPIVTVNGKDYRFINGIGYGIDGYCCEVGDKKQLKSDKPVNYTKIAIGGLLFHYKTPNAKITIDGVTKEYRRVWLAPTMKGRFYGGGMMVSPNQNRLSEDNMVSLVVLHKSRKLKTLIVFPTIFKGEHIKHTEMVEVMRGHNIEVEFDRPTALQIDGETIVGVTSYKVRTSQN